MSLYIFSVSVTSDTCIVCLLVFQIWCYSNDNHLNPGPHYQNNFFNFMSGNQNSLAKDNIQCFQFIEAPNSIYNYDLISICETSYSVELPEILLNDYTFVSGNNPKNTRHGWVALYYKNSLPVIVWNVSSSDESIVPQLNFSRKKLLFTVLYRSPAFNHTSPEFQAFLLNFESLHSSFKAENPLAIFLQAIFMHIPSPNLAN